MRQKQNIEKNKLEKNAKKGLQTLVKVLLYSYNKSKRGPGETGPVSKPQ